MTWASVISWSSILSWDLFSIDDFGKSESYLSFAKRMSRREGKKYPDRMDLFGVKLLYSCRRLRAHDRPMTGPWQAGPRWAQNRHMTGPWGAHKGPIKGPFWGLFRVGLMPHKVSHSGHLHDTLMTYSWHIAGVILKSSVKKGSQSGVILGHFGVILGHPGVVLCHPGVILRTASSWSHIGSSWVILESSSHRQLSHPGHGPSLTEGTWPH